MIFFSDLPYLNSLIKNLSEICSVMMKLQKILWKFHLDQGSENVLVWMVGYSVEQSMHFISSSGNLKQKRLTVALLFGTNLPKKM